jgi:hypothetical protein
MTEVQGMAPREKMVKQQSHAPRSGNVASENSLLLRRYRHRFFNSGF